MKDIQNKKKFKDIMKLRNCTKRLFKIAKKRLKLDKKSEHIKELTMTFNGKYDIVKTIGRGRTSDIYLCSEIACKTRKVAVKMFNQIFLGRMDASSAV